MKNTKELNISHQEIGELIKLQEGILSVAEAKKSSQNVTKGLNRTILVLGAVMLDKIALSENYPGKKDDD